MIIGRRDELTQLRGLLKSYKSEFCAVYGRRRVGKTFLIREAFNYKFTFQHTGILDATKSEQISEFVESVHRAGLGKGFSVGHAFDIHSQVTMNDLFD